MGCITVGSSISSKVQVQVPVCYGLFPKVLKDRHFYYWRFSKNIRQQGVSGSQWLSKHLVHYVEADQFLSYLHYVEADQFLSYLHFVHWFSSFN